MKIEVTEDAILFNDKAFDLPINLEDFCAHIGPCRKTTSEHQMQFATWDEHGFWGRLEGDSIIFFTVYSKPLPAYLEAGEHDPKNLFTGKLIAFGSKLRKNAKQVAKGGYSIYNAGEFFSISRNEEADEGHDIAADQYNIPTIDGEAIAFTDFNFKLAVMQVLMYEKALVAPKFDVEEFVEVYEAREIDIDEEGYDSIPEVKAYFEAYPIDKKWAKEITKLNQLNNNIYLQVCPYWDGSDDAFNITSTDDVKHFPNLKEVILYYDDEEEMVGQFDSIGINADYV